MSVLVAYIKLGHNLFLDTSDSVRLVHDVTLTGWHVLNDVLHGLNFNEFIRLHMRNSY